MSIPQSGGGPIERHEQLVALQSVGVRYVQGFHLGEPEPRLGAQRG